MSPFTSTLLAVLVALSSPGAALAQAARADLAEVARLIIEQTNDFRQAAGIGKTAPDPKLTQTARDFAEFMARTDRYGHGSDGKTLAERASSHGYSHCLFSENLAFVQRPGGYGTRELAQHLMEGWKKSHGHRKNMLDADATDTGVVVAQSAAPPSRFYAVQLFGRPHTLTLEFRIANDSGDVLRYELDGKPIQLPVGSTHIHQHCRSPKLTLRIPGQSKPLTLDPVQGDSYTVVRDGAQGYALKKG